MTNIYGTCSKEFKQKAFFLINRSSSTNVLLQLNPTFNYPGIVVLNPMGFDVAVRNVPLHVEQFDPFLILNRNNRSVNVLDKSNYFDYIDTPRSRFIEVH